MLQESPKLKMSRELDVWTDDVHGVATQKLADDEIRDEKNKRF